MGESEDDESEFGEDDLGSSSSDEGFEDDEELGTCEAAVPEPRQDATYTEDDLLRLAQSAKGQVNADTAKNIKYAGNAFKTFCAERQYSGCCMQGDVYIFSPDAACRYMENVLFVEIKKDEQGQPTIVESTARGYHSALASLWKEQVFRFPGLNLTPMLNDHIPYFTSCKTLRNFLKRKDRRNRGKDNQLGTAGEAMSYQDLRSLFVVTYSNCNTSKTAATHAQATVFAVGMARCGDIRKMKMHDLAPPYPGPTSVGPCQMIVQQFVLPEAKTAVRTQYLAFTRHKDPESCASFALANFFFHRFTTGGETFPSAFELDTWWQVQLFRSARDKIKPMSYKTLVKNLKAACVTAKVAPHRQATHFFRRVCALALSKEGLNLQVIKQLARWAVDACSMHYVNNMPVDGLLASGRWPHAEGVRGKALYADRLCIPVAHADKDTIIKLAYPWVVTLAQEVAELAQRGVTDAPSARAVLINVCYFALVGWQDMVHCAAQGLKLTAFGMRFAKHPAWPATVAAHVAELAKPAGTRYSNIQQPDPMMLMCKTMQAFVSGQADSLRLAAFELGAFVQQGEAVPTNASAVFGGLDVPSPIQVGPVQPAWPATLATAATGITSPARVTAATSPDPSPGTWAARLNEFQVPCGSTMWGANIDKTANQVLARWQDGVGEDPPIRLVVEHARQMQEDFAAAVTAAKKAKQPVPVKQPPWHGNKKRFSEWMQRKRFIDLVATRRNSTVKAAAQFLTDLMLEQKHANMDQLKTHYDSSNRLSAAVAAGQVTADVTPRQVKKNPSKRAAAGNADGDLSTMQQRTGKRQANFVEALLQAQDMPCPTTGWGELQAWTQQARLHQSADVPRGLQTGLQAGAQQARLFPSAGVTGGVDAELQEWTQQARLHQSADVPRGLEAGLQAGAQHARLFPSAGVTGGLQTGLQAGAQHARLFPSAGVTGGMALNGGQQGMVAADYSRQVLTPMDWSLQQGMGGLDSGGGSSTTMGGSLHQIWQITPGPKQGRGLAGGASPSVGGALGQGSNPGTSPAQALHHCVEIAQRGSPAALAMARQIIQAFNLQQAQQANNLALQQTLMGGAVPQDLRHALQIMPALMAAATAAGSILHGATATPSTGGLASGAKAVKAKPKPKPRSRAKGSTNAYAQWCQDNKHRVRDEFMAMGNDAPDGRALIQLLAADWQLNVKQLKDQEASKAIIRAYNEKAQVINDAAKAKALMEA